MQDSTIKKYLRAGVYRSVRFVAQMLPHWKETACIDVLPPMLNLPVALPLNYNKLPESFAKQFIKNKIIPKRRIFILKDVWVSGRAAVFKNLKIFIPSLPWLRDLALCRRGEFLIRQWLKNTHAKPVMETVALVYDNFSAENYYHWMIESLPRLLMVQKMYPDVLLLIPEPTPEYVRVTTALLGFHNVLPLSKKDEKVLKVSTLVMPELVYYYEEEEYAGLPAHKKYMMNGPGSFKNIAKPEQLLDFQAEELIVSVRKKLLSHFIDKPTAPERRIFVSRSRQKTRRIINEPEVLHVLEKYGFETIYFEDLTFEEQVKLMCQTAVFVSVHGANMVNILFLPVGAKVVEMMNINYLNDAYYLLSSSIGLPYFSVPCAMADNTINLSEDKILVNDAYLLVNIPELEDTICLALP